MNEFPFNLEKTIQATAVLVRAEPLPVMNYMRLLKLLYMVDRKSLCETGRPITGDRIVAMERGPVLSRLLHIIKAEDVLYPRWEEFFQRIGYFVRMVADPGIGKLCKYEIQTLTQMAERYRGYDEWGMVRVTHELDEVKKNDPGTRSKDIPLEDILEAVGRGEDLEAIRRDAAEQRQLVRALSGQL